MTAGADGAQPQPPVVRLAVPVYDLSSCGSGAVERALLDAPGVVDVYVNPATELAYVTCDPARTEPAELTRRITSVGARVGSTQTWQLR